MAALSLQAESACANTPDAIINLAQEIQALTGRVRHLLDAIDAANDEIAFPDLEAERRIYMVDRVLAFCALAESASKEAQDKAEEIEIAMMTLQRQARA